MYISIRFEGLKGFLIHFAGFLEFIFVLKLDFKHRAEAFDDMFVFFFQFIKDTLSCSQDNMVAEKQFLKVDNC